MRRIVLKVAYDGTAYCGWQVQPNGITIQQVLEETIEKLFHEKVHIVGSGRTDSGVHAMGQIAAFDLQHQIPVLSLVQALNSRLPGDIRIMSGCEAESGFNPRFDAKQKTYRYSFYEGMILPPMYRNYAVRLPYRMDWQRVEQMLDLLVGEHDFAAFHTLGSSAKTTVRTIYQASHRVSPEDEHLHYIEVTGNGFLYNMVRIIAGTAIEVGSSKRSLEMVQEALETGDRNKTGPTAPPQGLMLMDVVYESLCFKEKTEENA